MCAATVNRWTTPEPLWEESDDDLLDAAPTQAISGRNIDPMKLRTLLRIKFGAGTYDIHVSVYELYLDEPKLTHAIR